MDNVKEASCPAYHFNTLILKADNTLWITGNNSYGQIVGGTTVSKNVAVKVQDDVKLIIAGTYFSLLVKTDNTILGTGRNQYGQLGDATNQNKTSFVKTNL